MIKILLLLAACVACVYTNECGKLQRLKVKSQWVMVYGSHASNREGFAHEVWQYMFDKDSKLPNFFTRVRGDNLYSPEFNAHAVRVFGGLDICISLLNDEDTLLSQLTHLRDQHNERGIPHEYFDLFLDALHHTIPKHMDNYDLDAWSACYGVIRDGITKDLSSDD